MTRQKPILGFLFASIYSLITAFVIIYVAIFCNFKVLTGGLMLFMPVFPWILILIFILKPGTSWLLGVAYVLSFILNFISFYIIGLLLQKRLTKKKKKIIIIKKRKPSYDLTRL